MPTQTYLTADEVSTALGISKATLYSYVSRGLLRSEESKDKSRAKRYLAEDVARLQQRKEQRRNPAQAAATALHFGEPVLESAITLIADGQCYYRGQLVTELARSQPFEAVAALLWGSQLDAQTLFTEGTQGVALALPAEPALRNPLQGATLAEQFQLALLQAAPTDLGAYHVEATAVMRTGVRILHRLTQVATGQETRGRIAERLQRAWRPQAPTITPWLDSALILCADHELNISSFTARCVASAGSTPYAAVVAALAALQGYKHGGASERVAACLAAAVHDTPGTVRDYLRRGETLPGFGHHLYPTGDPRGRFLLELAQQVCPTAPILATATAVVETTWQAIQLTPNIDFGLVVLAQALELPPTAPFTLFALGRTAGWIGHVIEQYALDQMIRPRSRYVGRQPAA